MISWGFFSVIFLQLFFTANKTSDFSLQCPAQPTFTDFKLKLICEMPSSY